MKKWYLSKTLWFNLLAIIPVFIPGFAEYITPENQVKLIAFVNLVLRMVTKEQLQIK